MFKKLTQPLVVVAVSAFVLVGVLAPVASADSSWFASTSSEVLKGVNDVGGTQNTTNLTTFISSIIDVLLFIVGAVAVIMIIVGGIKYVTSGGDQNNVKSAKDTILYSVIGLIVALLAYAFVKFVVTNL